MKPWLKWLAVLAVLVGIPLVLRATILRPPPIAVKVVAAEKGLVEETVTNSRAGTVRSRHDAFLSMENAGKIAAVHRRPGDAVKTGDVLVELDDVEANAALDMARRERDTVVALVNESQAMYDNVVRELERNNGLVKSGVVSAEVVDQLRSRRDGADAQLQAAKARIAHQDATLEMAQVRLRKLRLVAPFDGVVWDPTGAPVSIVAGTAAPESPDRYIEPGEWGQPGKPVIRLIDPANLYVRAEIDEVDLARVKAGLPVRVLLDPYRGRHFPGKIARVAPVVSDAERQNRTLEIEVEFDGGLPVPDLRTGTSADVEVILDQAENVLRVPAYAVIEGKRVLVLENGRAADRPVTTGLRNWEFVEIRSGLNPGDRVILTLDKAEVKAGAEVSATAD